MPFFPFYCCSSQGGIRVIPSCLAQKLSPFLFSQQVKLAGQSRLKTRKSSVYSETASKVGEGYIGRGKGLPSVQLAQGSALPCLTSQITAFKAKDGFCADH